MFFGYGTRIILVISQMIALTQNILHSGLASPLIRIFHIESTMVLVSVSDWHFEVFPGIRIHPLDVREEQGF